MSLLPESASFEERVMECFLAHRGAGLMISPLDVQVVMAWSERGVPFEVVARGIRKAAERAVWDVRPGEPALRSLRACKREVEAEIKKWRARSAGRGGEASSGEGAPDAQAQAPARASLEEERWKKTKATVARLSRERPEVATACAALLMGPLSAPAPSLEVSDRVEALVYARLVRALPWPHRRALYVEAAALCGDLRLGSANARVLSRRFHRHALIRRALDLPSFW